MPTFPPNEKTLPPHVNINYLEVMPERQGFGPFQFNRD